MKYLAISYIHPSYTIECMNRYANALFHTHKISFHIKKQYYIVIVFTIASLFLLRWTTVVLNTIEISKEQPSLLQKQGELFFVVKLSDICNEVGLPVRYMDNRIVLIPQHDRLVRLVAFGYAQFL